jgi:hypothetical protein
MDASLRLGYSALTDGFVTADAATAIRQAMICGSAESRQRSESTP